MASACETLLHRHDLIGIIDILLIIFTYLYILTYFVEQYLSAGGANDLNFLLKLPWADFSLDF